MFVTKHVVDYIKISIPNHFDRRKLVMSSSELNNLWTTSSYNHEAKFHVDFDCIIGKLIKLDISLKP